MVTQQGDNVGVYAVKGNFDDAQTGVKRVFADKQLATELAKKDVRLSSANSINWGRLVPQIVYYFAAYGRLVRNHEIEMGQPVDFCVPTGNFGDILAGYYAKQMGLPVGKLVCASNRNNVLTEFFETGTYNARREFFRTTSPSMDILVSSNLERLLYHITGSDARVAAWMADLAEKGSYTVDSTTLETIRADFAAGCASDEEVAQEIKAIYQKVGYLCDPHTAVAFKVAREYQAASQSHNPMVVLSTASPYKFPRDVLTALGAEAPQSDFAAMDGLKALTNVPVPNSLAALRGQQERFNQVIEPSQIGDVAQKVCEV